MYTQTERLTIKLTDKCCFPPSASQMMSTVLDDSAWDVPVRDVPVRDVHLSPAGWSAPTFTIQSKQLSSTPHSNMNMKLVLFAALTASSPLGSQMLWCVCESCVCESCV